jgi:hypothetical protein
MLKLNRDTRNRNKSFCRDIDISFLLARITVSGSASGFREPRTSSDLLRQFGRFSSRRYLSYLRLGALPGFSSSLRFNVKHLIFPLRIEVADWKPAYGGVGRHIAAPRAAVDARNGTPTAPGTHSTPETAPPRRWLWTDLRWHSNSGLRRARRAASARPEQRTERRGLTSHPEKPGRKSDSPPSRPARYL